MMGSATSYPGLTEDLLEEYVELTYLSRGEILYLMKKFNAIDAVQLSTNYNHRFSKQQILDGFPVLKNNPFADRLFRVFSSQHDDCFSFEDMLDLCSVMSTDCSEEVKAIWAFRIYDIDEDNQISSKDISDIVDRLTRDDSNPENILDKESKNKIAKTIINEMKLSSHNEGIGLHEFQIIISKIPEFRTSFYFRL